MALDTYKAVKMLKDAGFEEPQAEAVVTTVGDALDDTVATKSDIAELRAEIRELEQRMTIKLGGLLVLALGLLTAINRLFE